MFVYLLLREDTWPVACLDSCHMSTTDNSPRPLECLLQDALESAMKNGLWGHALLLASKMDSRTHARVMTRYSPTVAWSSGEPCWLPAARSVHTGGRWQVAGRSHLTVLCSHTNSGFLGFEASLGCAVESLKSFLLTAWFLILHIKSQ